MAMKVREKAVAIRVEKVLNRLVDLVETQVERSIKSLKLPERKEILYLQERLAKLESRLSQIPVAKRAFIRGREVASRMRGKIGQGAIKKSRSASGARVCRISGCSRPVKARGLCGTHYQAARRRGQFKKK